MSVPSGKRTEPKLAVLTKARETTIHTIRVLSNIKIFNPDVDPILIDRMKRCAYAITEKSHIANKINANLSKEDKERRLKLQTEAINLCDILIVDIGLSKSIWHVKARKIEYWVGLVVETRKLLQGWKGK